MKDGKWPWPNLKYCYCSLRLFVNLCQGALIVDTTLWILHCGYHIVDTTLWIPHCGYYIVDTTLWILHCGYHIVDTTLTLKMF